MPIAKCDMYSSMDFPKLPKKTDIDDGDLDLERLQLAGFKKQALDLQAISFENMSRPRTSK